MVDNNKVKEVVQKFNSQNGNQAFTLKDLVIYFNTEHSEEIETIKKQIKEHLEWSNKNKDEGYTLLNKIQRRVDKSLADHDKILQHIIDEMPAKGFCEETQNVLNSWHPDKHEPPLNKKVDTLWYDRKLLKWLIGALIISTLASLGSILAHFVI